LSRVERDAVAGADDLDRAATPLAEADALGHPDRLAVRMRVPRRTRSRGKAHAGGANAPFARGRRDVVDIDGTGEPVTRPVTRVLAVPLDLHARLLFSLIVASSCPRFA